MDWRMYNQYGPPPNGPYGAPGQGTPPMQYQQQPQYQHMGQSQPPVMHQHSPMPPAQYQIYQPQPPPDHYNAAPMVMIPQRPPEYLNQFHDYTNYPIHQQHAQPQPQPQPQPRPQQRQSSQQYQREPHRPPSVPQQQIKPPEPSYVPPPAIPDTPPVDFRLLLASLADEYITAARRMGPAVALSRQPDDLEKYHKLMATGMGCLDSIMRKQRLQPREEALLRLRYATLLHQETNNDMDAEQILSKGILLCERNRLLDLKYSMHHLLAQVLFKSSPKAALKSLDKLIPDVETLQHVVWVYALRFLRASLSMQIGNHQDHLAALQQLRSIATLAQSQGDVGIFITVAAFESIVHLKVAGPDAIEQARQAIASARSYQLEVPAGRLAQIWALLDVAEVACALQTHSSADQIQLKLQAMHLVMDNQDSKKIWGEGSTFSVVVDHNVDLRLVETTGGIFQTNSEGQTLVTFSWLSQRDLYMLGYYLSGVATIQSKPSSDEKASNYLQEGINMAKECLAIPSKSSSNLSSASDRALWRTTVQWYMRLELAFITCFRGDWKAARQSLSKLSKDLDRSQIVVDNEVRGWMQYLTALVDQSTGDISSALSIYQSSIFSLPSGNAKQQDTAHPDVCILAGLNTLLIIRSPSHPQHDTYHELLSSLEPLCTTHSDKSIQSAFSLLRAIAPRTNSSETLIVKTKQHLQSALQAAKVASNNQLLAISLNFMTALFFRDIVGEQAEKSARTAQQLSKRARSNIWLSVANGQLADTLERCGKTDDANQTRTDAQRLVKELPTPLKNICEGSI